MTTLAEQFQSLMDEHDLSGLGVSRLRTESGLTFFSAEAHADSLCSLESADTPAKALTKAITKLNTKRGRAVVVVEPEAA